MLLTVLFKPCVVTPIDSCFGFPIICPVHINYPVLHCWGRIPSFTKFTSPLQLHQCTEREGCQLLVLFNLPILHWVMCGFCLCSFYTPNNQTSDVGLLLLMRFTSPFQLPHHPAGAGMLALELFTCQACTAARMVQDPCWLYIQALPREGLGWCMVPLLIASATCHAHSYHGTEGEEDNLGCLFHIPCKLSKHWWCRSFISAPFMVPFHLTLLRV